MVLLGIDDTDSKKGMCTTYLAAVLVEALQNYGIKGYPRLIRLNPNIKYKTRGNGAVAIEIEADEDQARGIMDIAVRKVEEMAELDDPETNPGIVLLSHIPPEVEKFSEKVVRDVVTIQEAMDLAKKYGMVHAFKNGRGVIGALAAIGFSLQDDRTYELVAYRRKESWGTPRRIDKTSVLEADWATYPHTWDTVDITNDKTVFSPHSPCPVLFGIRGDDVEAIKRAFKMIKSERIERYIIFKTNQSTDAHLVIGEIASAKNGRSYILGGTVVKQPHSIQGGHVFFTIAEDGHEIDCAAYEPTKNFRDVIRQLRVGDEVLVYGSVKDQTVNLEKIEITSLKDQFAVRNPSCPKCQKRMKSSGKNQGYRCRKCGTKSQEEEIVPVHRSLELGLYETPPCARRHISKPLIRMSGRMSRREIHPSR
ncbi:MAG: tRNA(Ile)(2)-agmatinylcytidine synthase [Methanocellales archaeon]|nr:tRNA(Ile)(2)-agmatinylcytidine synthase [Methanocellales archaeon]MDD3291920.1 tRNA(Ile)(2)-agmatinylcytidine synthase [Methanocellales archaeon]MDD5235769.1 tRNA(Ile)(2)-agmatinylcytidine synthase [Methanocellales archaeon]MDD5485526.1 tRNA(Ile)(2)-agmatinylcytidine synthase [Methanocellales archaeon]